MCWAREKKRWVKREEVVVEQTIEKKKSLLTVSPRRVELDDLVDYRGVAEALTDGVAHDLRVAAAGCVVRVCV